MKLILWGLIIINRFSEGIIRYVKYIINTVVFTIVTTVAKTVVGLALALLLTQKFIKCKNFQRMIIFSPQVMSYLVVGLVFKSMLHPTTGFLNNFLRSIGLDGLAKNWLTDLQLVFSYRYGSRYLERHGIHYGGCYSWVAFYIA